MGGGKEDNDSSKAQCVNTTVLPGHHFHCGSHVPNSNIKMLFNINQGGQGSSVTCINLFHFHFQLEVRVVKAALYEFFISDM